MIGLFVLNGVNPPRMRLTKQDIDPEDHKTLDALAPAAHGEGSKTLADLIFSKMEGGAVTQGMEDEEEEGPPDPRKGLNPKVVEVYTK